MRLNCILFCSYEEKKFIENINLETSRQIRHRKSKTVVDEVVAAAVVVDVAVGLVSNPESIQSTCFTKLSIIDDSGV